MILIIVGSVVGLITLCCICCGCCCRGSDHTVVVNQAPVAQSSTVFVQNQAPAQPLAPVSTVASVPPAYTSVVVDDK